MGLIEIAPSSSTRAISSRLSNSQSAVSGGVAGAGGWCIVECSKWGSGGCRWMVYSQSAVSGGVAGAGGWCIVRVQ